MDEPKEGNKAWVVVHTKPHMEAQVDMMAVKQGIETYLPTVQRYVARRRRREPVPFFPGYLFAKVDLLSPQYMALPWTPGLRSIVKFGGRVAQVPEEIVTRIRERIAQMERSGAFDEAPHGLRHGDRVRITAGPLKDIDAVFDRSLSKKGRVKVLLDILGRISACEIDPDWLEKAG